MEHAEKSEGINSYSDLENFIGRKVSVRKVVLDGDNWVSSGHERTPGYLAKQEDAQGNLQYYFLNPGTLGHTKTPDINERNFQAREVQLED